MKVGASSGRGGTKAGGTHGGAVCPDSARVLGAVRDLLSEETSFSSSSSSLASLAPELKTHLARCATCAAEARVLDPTLLFAPLAASLAPAPDAEDVRRVVDDVLADVRRRSRLASPPATRRPFSRRFLQAAALVVLAAGLFGVAGVRLARREPAPAGLTSASNETQDAKDLGDALDVRPPARPLIQDLKNPGARVYEFAAVSPKEPNVVFIADPHADL